MKINDRPIKEYGLFLLQGHSHPSPQVVNKTVKVPGVAGVYHMGSEISSTPFMLPFGILEDNAIATQRKLRLFMRECFDENGNTKPLKIVYDYEPDKYYTGYVEGLIDVQRLHEYANPMINITVPDPFAYSLVSADELTWGNEVITFESYYLLGHEGTAGMIEVTENTSFNLSVDGYAVKPIIEINGSADDLTVSVGNQSFSLPQFDGEWEIDSSMYSALYNGQNAFGEYEGDFITLSQGTNEMKINGSNMDLSIRVKYEDRYV